MFGGLRVDLGKHLSTLFHLHFCLFYLFGLFLFFGLLCLLYLGVAVGHLQLYGRFHIVIVEDVLVFVADLRLEFESFPALVGKGGSLKQRRLAGVHRLFLDLIELLIFAEPEILLECDSLDVDFPLSFINPILTIFGSPKVLLGSIVGEMAHGVIPF